VRSKTDVALLKESKLMVEQYNRGHFEEFNQTLERIILQYSSNPVRVVNRVELLLLCKGVKRGFLGKD
jgi:hypothetical protein